MTAEQGETLRSITIRVPTRVLDDFAIQSRRQGLSMSWRIVQWMHQQTGHKSPPVPRRGAKPAEKPHKPPKR